MRAAGRTRVVAALALSAALAMLACLGGAQRRLLAQRDMVLSISNPPTAPRVQPAPQAQPAPRALPAPRERPARAHARPFVPLTPAGSGCGVARTKSNASAPGAHRLLVVSVAPPPLLRTPTVVLQREYDARCGYDHRLRREGGNYAHWLYDNYEALPPFMAFVHGHAVAWHQPSALPVLVRVAEELVELLERAGGECGAEGLFVPLGTTMTAQWCKHVAQPTPFGRVLRHTYAAWLEPDLPPPLPCLQAELGAQFVVSRSRVRARPRAFYRRLAEYTATCTPDRDGMYARAGEPKPDRLQPEHCFHNMLEYAWHVIFGQPPCDAERVPSPREQSRRWAWRHPGGRLFRGLLPYRGTCAAVLAACTPPRTRRVLSSLPPGMELGGFARQAADAQAGSGQGGRLVVAGIQ